ncbi:SapC family protein [Pseudomonas matsuisoli]|uniref:SapC family protein n=1 Tax=Pseudomonas matsuisoli TaxID=1515666 RepID=A0A917PWQ6_9PSED|nr:SapC family protein [Pseudomonas matsuisoli]GGJ95300.1 SapC family protein [Pseudomonas matsuisoli]
MTTLLFYRDIKALNREEHKALRLQPVENSAFAAGMHLVPLAGLEFFQAVRHYPIVFIGEKEKPTPIALLGLEKGHNGYLDRAKQWQTNTYIPAFVRRYPFVLAADGESNFTVCFDAAYEGWGNEGRALFEEDGRNTPFLDEMIGFLQNFTKEMERTQHFASKLVELNLLESRSLKLTHRGGAQFTLNDFQAVNEERFLALPDEQVLELNRLGFLGWIYAHLMSLGNANHLFEHYLASKERQG